MTKANNDTYSKSHKAVGRKTFSKDANNSFCNGSSSDSFPRNVNNFIKQTYIMISSSDSNIISWTDDGKRIAIKDQERLSNEVLSRYFKSSKFETFARNLNYYGFKKIPVSTIRRVNNNALSPLSNQNQGSDSITSVYGSTSSSSSSSSEKESMIVYENQFFKLGRLDLINKVKRQNGGSSSSSDDNQAMVNLQCEIQELKGQIATLHESIRSTNENFEKRIQQLYKVGNNACNEILYPKPTAAGTPSYSRLNSIDTFDPENVENVEDLDDLEINDDIFFA